LARQLRLQQLRHSTEAGSGKIDATQKGLDYGMTDGNSMGGSGDSSLHAGIIAVDYAFPSRVIAHCISLSPRKKCSSFIFEIFQSKISQ